MRQSDYNQRGSNYDDGRGSNDGRNSRGSSFDGNQGKNNKNDKGLNNNAGSGCFHYANDCCNGCCRNSRCPAFQNGGGGGSYYGVCGGGSYGGASYGGGGGAYGGSGGCCANCYSQGQRGYDDRERGRGSRGVRFAEDDEYDGDYDDYRGNSRGSMGVSRRRSMSRVSSFRGSRSTSGRGSRMGGGPRDGSMRESSMGTSPSGFRGRRMNQSMGGLRGSTMRFPSRSESRMSGSWRTSMRGTQQSSMDGSQESSMSGSRQSGMSGESRMSGSRVSGSRVSRRSSGYDEEAEELEDEKDDD